MIQTIRTARLTALRVASAVAAAIVFSPILAQACHCARQAAAAGPPDCGLTSTMKVVGLFALLPFVLAMTVFLVVRRVMGARERNDANITDANSPR